MKKKYLKNECGDLSYFTIFVILAINMLLAFVLLFASVKINCINIRNAAKMELNNVSARIYADTFHSQREANLSSYMADLHLGSSTFFINGNLSSPAFIVQYILTRNFTLLVSILKWEKEILTTNFLICLKKSFRK